MMGPSSGRSVRSNCVDHSFVDGHLIILGGEATSPRVPTKREYPTGRTDSTSRSYVDESAVAHHLRECLHESKDSLTTNGIGDGVRDDAARADHPVSIQQMSPHRVQVEPEGSSFCGLFAPVNLVIPLHHGFG